MAREIQSLMALNRGVVASSEAERIFSLLRRLGLPVGVDRLEEVAEAREGDESVAESPRP